MIVCEAIAAALPRTGVASPMSAATPAGGRTP
jgi:hypothetical protein